MFYKLLIIFLLNFMVVFSKNDIESKIILVVLAQEGNSILKSERELSKYGIRENTLNEYNKKYNTNYQIETLTKNQAIEISAELVKKYRINEIKDNYFKLIIFDTIFNTGYFSGSSILQKSLNRYYGKTVKIDGIMGSKTINLLNKVKDSERFIQIFLNERLTYYKNLKEWKIYKNGWIIRIDNLKNNKLSKKIR
ncbi:MAG: putative peptidoglycan-binding domain-containing protein [Cetobacterium somerae]|uniref:putative peptidoglycan-binding domain-containing protein n=1 Tax=Cetobacterium somerae TaxID=188913 RepID=UPI003F35D11C